MEIANYPLVAEADIEGLQVEHATHRRSLNRGLKARFNPSPRRLRDRIVTTKAAPGRIVSQGAVRSISRPLPIIDPQLMRLGSPWPRNARADSIRMAVATMTDAVTMMGGSAFGNTSWKMILAGPYPRLRAAVTNSLLTRERNSARTSLATMGQEAMPMAREITCIDGCPIVTMTITSKNAGVVCTISVIRTNRPSTHPPKNPAMAPTAVPMTIPRNAAVAPISNDARVP